MEKILYKLAGSLSHDLSARWCLVFQKMSIQYGHLPYKITRSQLVGGGALTSQAVRALFIADLSAITPWFLTEVDYLVHERSIKRPKLIFSLCKEPVKEENSTQVVHKIWLFRPRLIFPLPILTVPQSLSSLRLRRMAPKKKKQSLHNWSVSFFTTLFCLLQKSEVLRHTQNKEDSLMKLHL